MNVLQFFYLRAPVPVDEDLRGLMHPWRFGLADGPLERELALSMGQEGVLLDAQFEPEVSP